MKMFTFKRIVFSAAWLVTMVSALGAGAYGHKYRDRIRAIIRPVNTSAIMTNLHTVKVEQLAIPAEGRDGGIEALDDGILFVNRLGKFYFIDAGKTLQDLRFTAPVNIDEFNADPFIKKALYPELFGVKDIALQPVAGGGLRVLVSHSHWHRAKACNTLRLSALETTREKLRAGGAVGTWRTVFETTPCRPLEKQPDGNFRLGLGIGGRVEPMLDGAVLLTVGGFDPENELVIEAAQKSDNSYGKTLRIDPVTGNTTIFTFGHRNPQGLAITSNGRIWLTEHAARGGDELNLLGDQKNYGYPRVAFGTQYESMTWPLSEQQGRHDGFEKPMFVWTPSIGVSQMIVLEKAAFPTWQGDLIVSSLGAQSLFRVRVDGDRVIFAEPIPVGHRVRDIVEANDGAIVLKTDDDFLLYLRPLDATTAATPLERGTILAAQCQGCHTVTADGAARIGPPLWNVVGRDVADASGFEYSDALRNRAGRWTPESLAAFLKDPNAFAPGTKMVLGKQYSASEIDDIIAYLQTLK